MIEVLSLLASLSLVLLAGYVLHLHRCLSGMRNDVAVIAQVLHNESSRVERLEIELRGLLPRKAPAKRLPKTKAKKPIKTPAKPAQKRAIPRKKGVSSPKPKK